jgi:hypothetical protein
VLTYGRDSVPGKLGAQRQLKYQIRFKIRREGAKADCPASMLTSDHSRWSESPFSDSSSFDREQLLIDDDADSMDGGRATPANMDIDLANVWDDS